MATLNVNQLMRDSACFQCLTPGQHLAIQSYLLALDAGGSLDPRVLLNNARQFQSLDPGQHAVIQTGLLCDIAAAVAPEA